jgi:hypothetical protein
MAVSVHDNEAERERERERGKEDKGILSNQSLSEVSEGRGHWLSSRIKYRQIITVSLTRSPPFGAHARLGFQHVGSPLAHTPCTVGPSLSNQHFKNFVWSHLRVAWIYIKYCIFFFSH